MPVIPALEAKAEVLDLRPAWPCSPTSKDGAGAEDDRITLAGEVVYDHIVATRSQNLFRFPAPTTKPGTVVFITPALGGRDK